MRSLIAATGAVLALAGAAQPQETGSVAAGHELARQVCAECHAIEAHDPLSPHADAPPFRDVANQPEMTALALSVWFRTPHPTMPNFVLKDDETEDLIAFILSLRTE